MGKFIIWEGESNITYPQEARQNLQKSKARPPGQEISALYKSDKALHKLGQSLIIKIVIETSVGT